MGVADLFACNPLDCPKIEICILETFANDPKAITKRSVKKAIALRVVSPQRLRVLIGGPSATPIKR